jgi:translation elongation factor EF-4
LPLQEAQSGAGPTAVENLINNYHEQALGQTRAQFWFSVVAATIGFGWILYAGTEIKADNFVTISKVLSGMVMDAVAFLFFRQASKTRQRATELYDRLRRDKQMTESVKLVASIEDVRVRSAVKAQVAFHMAGLQPNPIDLSTFL